MNKRIASIIRDLARSDSRASLTALAQEYAVSVRTIRNDINSINALLDQNGIELISLGPAGALQVPPGFSSLLGRLPQGDYYSYHLSHEERVGLSAAMIVGTSGYVTLAEIAERLYVSRTTAIADLDDVKRLVAKGGLSVESRSKHGLCAEGLESAKRMFLAELCTQVLADIDVGPHRNPAGTLSPDDVPTIRKILSEQCHAHGRLLADASFDLVAAYLCLTVDRCRSGCGIEEQASVILPTDALARDLISYLEQYCGIRATDHEQRFLSGLLASCRYVERDDLDVRDMQMQVAARRFIRRVSRSLGTDFTTDFELYDFLSNHLESMFGAMPLHYPDNTEVNEIVEGSPEISDAVRENLGVLPVPAGRKVTETEISFIAVHFCAAMERKRNREGALRVAVVCNAGVGTSHLLAERLRRRLGFRIVRVLPSHEAAYLAPDAVDLVVSTVPLKECAIRHVVVPATPGEGDYERVRKTADEVRQSLSRDGARAEGELSARGLLQRLEPLICEHAPEQADELLPAVRAEVRRYFGAAQRLEEDILSPYLHQLLSSDHIQLGVACTDWREAIAVAAKPLVEQGCIERRYISAMIENAEENGPYFVLCKGFAVPHAGPECGARKMGMNLVRLAEPVPFGDEEFDPVEFVCVLSAVDHRTHLRAFFNLVSVIGSEGFLDALHEAPDPVSAARLIERCEFDLIR